jgi:hypothetical protein
MGDEADCGSTREQWSRPRHLEWFYPTVLPARARDLVHYVTMPGVEMPLVEELSTYVQFRSLLEPVYCRMSNGGKNPCGWDDAEGVIDPIANTKGSLTLGSNRLLGPMIQCSPIVDHLVRSKIDFYPSNIITWHVLRTSAGLGAEFGETSRGIPPTFRQG